jgi:glycine cleavage system H protein
MYYTDSHEWIDREGKIGITAYAKEELGEIVYIQLPKLAHLVTAGEEIAVLESTKAAADIYAPVSGEVIAVNEALLHSPDLLNQSPEERGWLFQIRLTNPEELEKLMDRTAYLSLVTGS